MKFVLPPGKWRNTRVKEAGIITSDGKMTIFKRNGVIQQIPANKWGPFGWYRIGVKAYYERVEETR